jgi:hypothetical protein
MRDLANTSAHLPCRDIGELASLVSQLKESMSS